MANAFSYLHNYDQSLYNPDFNLIGKAMAYKQNKLDMNRAKLENLYDQYSALDVLKGVDQEYVDKKLKKIKNIADRYSNGDLSNDYLTRSIAENIDQVVDQNVINAVQSTALYRADQQEWQELKKNNPEKYSDRNYRYAQQAAMPWLQSDEVGAVYKGGAGVIEYVDINKEFTELGQKLAKQFKWEYKELSPGRGFFRDVVTKKVVDSGKVRQAMDGYWNEKMSRQATINGWDMYNGMSNDQLKSVYTSYVDGKASGIQSKINSYQNFLSRGDITQSQRQNTQELLKKSAAELENLRGISNFDAVLQSKGRQGVTSTLYFNQFTDRYVDAYSQEPTVTDIQVYENDVKNKEYQYKLDKLKIDEFNAQTKRMKALDSMSDNKKSGSSGSLQESIEAGDVTISEAEIPSEYGDKDNVLATINATKRKSAANVKQQLGLSTEDLYDLKNLSLNDIQGNVYKLPNGKTVSLKNANGQPTPAKEALLDYYTNVVKIPSAERKIYTAYENTADNIINKFADTFEGLKRGETLDYNLSEIADFDVWYKDNGIGGFYKLTGEAARREQAKRNVESSFFDPLEGTSIFTSLIEKSNEGSLNREEEFNLRVYALSYLSNDPKLSEEKKSHLSNYIRSNYMSKVFSTDKTIDQGKKRKRIFEYASITSSGRKVDAIRSALGGESINPLGQIDPAVGEEIVKDQQSPFKKVHSEDDPAVLPKPISLPGRYSSSGRSLGVFNIRRSKGAAGITPPEMLSAFTAGEMESWDRQYGDISKDIDDLNSQIDGLSTFGIGQENLVSTRKVTFSPKTDNHKKIYSIVSGRTQQLPTGIDKNQPINIQREITEDGFTGKFIVWGVADQQGKDKPYYTLNEDNNLKVTEEDLRNAGIPIAGFERPVYSVEDGQPIDLGPATDDIFVNVENEKGGTEVLEEYNQIKAFAQQVGGEEMYTNTVKDYAKLENKEIKFSIIPDPQTEVYNFTMLDENGQYMYHKPLNYSEIYKKDLLNQEGYEVLKFGMMNEYILNKLQKTLRSPSRSIATPNQILRNQ